MKVDGKVIVVTGAGSGIGRALVLLLMQKGAKVAAMDIDGETLKETAALAAAGMDAISTHVVDVSNRKQVEALPEAVIGFHGAVDGLVNNAGIIQPFVPLGDLDYAAMERVLKVNLWGQIYMLKSFLPELLKRPEAHIVNVSSMGGFFPFPGQTLYGASKAAVKLLSEGLYAELLESHVGVSVVFPGAIDTNIGENSGVAIEGADAESSPLPLTPPETAAEVIVSAIEKKAFQAYIGRDAKLMNLLYKLSPKLATRLIQRLMKGMLPQT